MVARTKPQQRGAAQLAFEAIAIEGGLLSPDWLARAAQLQAGSQGEADYRIPKGLSLRDEIGRYWRIAQAHWNDFEAGRSSARDLQALAERFVTALLRDSFGFASLARVATIEINERAYPVGQCALGQRVPVVVAAAGTGVDEASALFGDQNRKRTAFGLAQEYLNAAEGAMWGIATDGCTLRVLRDNASLTRPAWIQVDLERIFREQRYADFAALWLILHETRFGEVDQPVAECALERWRSAGLEAGVTARGELRNGVEKALVALGQGFLAHPDNRALRDALQSGALSTNAYFQQLLRLVYRVIFLLTAEERELLHPADVGEDAKHLYAQGYSLHRLRDRAVKRSAHDRHSDLWEGVKIVFGGLALGEARLGLPALAGIFAKTECPALDTAKLENRALMMAMFRLTWLREKTGLSRVNWRDMGPEELGSVYESLLELVPQVVEGGRKFAFATGGETKGNARKTSGSYYTPESLVQVLLDSALEPVIADTIAKSPGNPVDALLSLSIVDPACGSGHFLLAAARRLAAHVARLQANGTPSAPEYRHALRQVIGRCIYGVDLNPLAVELCKVSLWMEALEPGLPLTFLNSHIQHGNALLGTTPELMAKGIPDAAWDAIEGDDKKVASALKKRNKAGASGQRSLDLFSSPTDSESKSITAQVSELDRAPDADLSALSKKESRWEDILHSDAYQHQKLVADAWCAAFVWPKDADHAEAAPTNELWRQLRDNHGKPPALTLNTVTTLAEQYRFFHWHLQFPQVFAKGGFDVVLGNPPWERVKLQEQEFFASRSDEISQAVNAAARKKLIANLRDENPPLWDEWCAASRHAEGESHSIRQTGRYPLCGKGDVNTYAIFAEHNRSTLGPRGRAGFIVPTGIATDDTTKEYFGTLVNERELARFYSFENEEFVFPGVHHAFRFALLTVARGQGAGTADLVFFARQVSALADPERHFTLTPADFETLNPNTRTCPTFRSRRDADINLAMYRRAGVLWREGDDEGGNPWGLRFMAMLHMANDSGLFKTRAEMELAGCTPLGNRFESKEGHYAPLVEGRMVDHFDHRYASVTVEQVRTKQRDATSEFLSDAQKLDPVCLPSPRAWVSEHDVQQRLQDVWARQWLLGWRDITASSNQRTVVAAIIPRTATGDTLLLAMPEVAPVLVCGLCANLCAFCLDYAARQKVGGVHLKYHTFKQLPVLSPTTYDAGAAWSRDALLIEWLRPRVIELAYTAWDLESFTHDVGYDGPPFRWDPARRFLLRCELDAAFFHLYGLSRDDTDYVMDTFPIVRKNDEKAHGEYRTKRVILEIYDAMAEAARTGIPYKTLLDPPPADPRVAHPDTRVAPPKAPVAVPFSLERAALLDAGAWSWTPSQTPAAHGLALAACLKAISAPRPEREVRLAAVIAMNPRLLVPRLSHDEVRTWIRLVGADAEPHPEGVISFVPSAAPWAKALLHLRTHQHLVEDPQAGTWAPGASIGAVATSEPLNGRARMIWAVLARTAQEALVADLPHDLRGWVDASAA